MPTKKLILASKSPRRSQLLREAGFDFVIKTRDVDESYPEHLSPIEIAKHIARQKALGCADFLENEHDILLTSDTIVTLEGKIYGKPKDYNDAINILQELSGKTHQVITAVCLYSIQKECLFHSAAEVTFASLSRAEIDYYLEKCQPYDKAGAYGIQEWIGHCKITKMIGTYPTIMGLPVNLVYKNLSEF